MSILTEVLQTARTIVNETIGNRCSLINTITGHELPCLVIINPKTEIYQGGQFAGTVTTGIFDLTKCEPQIGNELIDLETGIEYTLSGIETETPTKAVFVLGEI